MRPGWLLEHKGIAAGLTLLGLMVSFLPGWQALEYRALGLLERTLPDRPLTAEAVVIDIADGSAGRDAAWPWPRDRVATLVRKLDEAGAAVITLILPLDRPQPLPDALVSAAHDPDRVLAEALIASGHVVMASAATRDPAAGLPLHPPESGWARVPALRPLLSAPGDRDVPAGRPLLPLFAAAAAASGRSEAPADVQLRLSEPLLYIEEGRAQPSLLLQTLAVAEGDATSDIEVIAPLGVNAGWRWLATDSRFHVYPYPPAGPSVLPRVAAEAVLAGRVPRRALAGKAVFVGLDGAAAPYRGARGGHWSAAAWQAYSYAALQQGQLLTVPPWGYGLARALLLLFGIVLLWLPRLLCRPVALSGSVALAFVLGNVSLVLLLVRSLWLPLVMPGLFLVAAHLLLVARQQLAQRAEGLRALAERAWCELAANLQGQGQLDRAFDSLMNVRLGTALLEPLYGLAMDFERRRQFVRALRVYDRIAEYDGAFRDVAERRRQLAAIPEAFPGARNGGGSAAATMVIDGGSIARPVIGRYEVERELGHGAMGVVYLGKDPKIGRTVAIKTLSLTDEFEEGQLEEVRRRFYQEAETAGQLHHADIVTIYDVGEEHDLAYIAMDYVEGDSLRPFIRKEDLLPVCDVLEIGVRVAEALDYAHRHKVVHRDIKPENILYDPGSKDLKVTDFGIACLTDHSRTRTGTVLGSPFYMSPEQINGRRVDGRADLYSLGVTLFHLLTGELPFSGDTLPNLMYRITHDRPPAIRKLRKSLPTCVTRIINRALEKDPQRRYATGSEMAAALRNCAARCREGGGA